MKCVQVFVVLALGCAAGGSAVCQESGRVRELEAAGDSSGARAALGRDAHSRPGDIGALTAYAEFLDRYGDPECRTAYRELLAALRKSGNSARAAVIARRLVRLDMAAGDSSAAAQDTEVYSALGGSRLPAAAAAAEGGATILIPGPFRSFARMAALPPDGRPEDVLPALGRNVVTSGYRASHGSEALDPTEYLKLIHRYLDQARELQSLAGSELVIRVAQCESPVVGELLRILGYRMRGGCGSDLVLETVNAGRAFVTTDSGFPVHQLEQALRTAKPFAYDFHPAAIPVLLDREYWMTGAKGQAEFIDAYIADPSLCRLYLAMSKLDSETLGEVRRAIPFTRLKAFAHVWDFYGGLFEIRGGKAVVPGGARSASAWADLAGAPPDQGVQFFDRLVARDDGWLASYFDSLARIHGPTADYLTEPSRMKRFYTAIRGRITTPGPARPVFRANADMMLLTARLRVGADGKPHLPGGLAVWKSLFIDHPPNRTDARLTKLAASWKDPDDVVEALFALCRKNTENMQLKVFMTLSEIDRDRAAPLETAIVDRLAREFETFGSQYAIFAESHSLSGASIGGFLDSAAAISKIRDQLLRSDAAGCYQGLISLWQILVRQQDIRDDKADAVFGSLTVQFAQVRNARDVFDAARKGLSLTFEAASRLASGSAQGVQDRLVDLLAGPSEGSAEDSHIALASDIGRILDAQHILSFDTLFQVADRFESLARGEKSDAAGMAKLAARFAENLPPRPALSNAEKLAQPFGNSAEKHVEAQRGFNPRSAADKAGGDPARLRELRGQLTPFLRDSLVALNYAYYAPPGAEVLYANGLFVRSHDFIGTPPVQATWAPVEVAPAGWPSNGGGRLIGSLAGLPYALAQAEQNFLVPSQTQALIWNDLVPQMIVSSTLPRWWTVTPAQLHWVGLHLRYARESLAECVFDPALRARAMDAIAPLASPLRIREVAALLGRGQVQQALDRVTPSELFALAAALAPSGREEDSAVLADLRDLSRRFAKDTEFAAISRAFGTPKPTLASSYRPELLNLRTFPTLMGYSSQILAESWESNTLYWAALADELYLAPADLNVRIPAWTRKLVERIFATNLDDWPAVLRSLRAVGEDERSRGRSTVAQAKAAMDSIGER